LVLIAQIYDETKLRFLYKNGVRLYISINI